LPRLVVLDEPRVEPLLLRNCAIARDRRRKELAALLDRMGGIPHMHGPISVSVRRCPPPQERSALASDARVRCLLELWLAASRRS
jgi:hypothetical protein